MFDQAERQGGIQPALVQVQALKHEPRPQFGNNHAVVGGAVVTLHQREPRLPEHVQQVRQEPPVKAPALKLRHNPRVRHVNRAFIQLNRVTPPHPLVSVKQPESECLPHGRRTFHGRAKSVQPVSTENPGFQPGAGRAVLRHTHGPGHHPTAQIERSHEKVLARPRRGPLAQANAHQPVTRARLALAKSQDSSSRAPLPLKTPPRLPLSRDVKPCRTCGPRSGVTLNVWRTSAPLRSCSRVRAAHWQQR